MVTHQDTGNAVKIDITYSGCRRDSDVFETTSPLSTGYRYSMSIIPIFPFICSLLPVRVTGLVLSIV